MERLHFVAVCGPDGAESKWTAQRVALLRDRDVRLWADKDEAGRVQMQRAAESLHGVAASVRIVPPLDVGPKGDIADLIDAGATRENVLAIAETAQPWTPERMNRAVVLTMADVVPESITYLYEPYIPCGKVTLFEGDGGVGKTRCLLAITASITNGLVPGPPSDTKASGTPETVLLLNGEDGAGDTLRPCLEGMGADLGRVKLLTGLLTEGGELPLVLDSDGLEQLENTVEELRPALVIIDPIIQHLGAKVDVYRPNEVRAVLAPLMRIAHVYSCAVVIVRHLNKASASQAIYRGQGSQDFYSAARSVLLIGPDPNNPIRSVMVHSKCNYAAKGQSQAFSISGGIFGWLGPIDMAPQDLFAGADHTHRDVLELYDVEAAAPLTPQTLVSELDMKPETARQRLRRMCKSGELTKVRYGEYVPANIHRHTVTLSQLSQLNPESDESDESDSDERGESVTLSNDHQPGRCSCGRLYVTLGTGQRRCPECDITLTAVTP
jgi:putative DNA primase/helicase